jgi:outer membrane protein assembly factor BamB
MRPPLLATLAALGLGVSAVASDWPQWRGPQRDGISAESGLLGQWPAEGPKLLWREDEVGDGFSTPSVVGARLYLMSNRGLENEFVQALSTEDGKPLWTTRVGNVGNPNQDPPYPKARSTPTVDGDSLYALGSDGDLVCLDAQGGRIRWQKSLRKDFGGIPGQWAYAESPLVDGEVVVVTPGGGQATLVGLDKKTGALRWKSAVPGGDPAEYTSAAIVQGGGRRQYVQYVNKGIVGVDARTGRFLWRYAEAAKGPAQYFSPVARDGYVYGGALGVGGGLVRLKAEGDGVAAEQVYFERGLPNGLGGAVLVGDTLYGVDLPTRALVAAEFTTGKVKWRAEDFGRGSITYAEGHLYFHDEDGDVRLVEARPDAFREKGRFTPSAPPQRKTVGRFTDKAYAFPVIANGRLYIRDLGSLWAYDIRARP